MSDLATLVDWTVGSLKSEPERWIFTEYEAKHDSGITVWIRNASYGLSIEKKGVGSFGGVTAFSTFFGWLTWRGRIYRSAKQAVLKKLLKARSGASA